jgi:hypothetical protein
MKRLLHIICLSILAWGLGIGAWGLALENRECLECHGDPKLVSVRASGEVRSVFVDRAAWNHDVHNRMGLRCVDCHPQASPYTHPRGGFAKADCSRCHPEECASFAATVHAQKVGLTQKALPRCEECHTKHGVRKKEDPQSSIHETRIRSVCLACHDEVQAAGLLGQLATFRISAHRKENVSMSFNLKACLLCHQEDAVHGEARLYNGVCNDCHKPRVKRAFLGAVGVTHLLPIAKEQPLTFLLKWLDDLVALIILVAIAAALVSRNREKIASLFKRG